MDTTCSEGLNQPLGIRVMYFECIYKPSFKLLMNLKARFKNFINNTEGRDSGWGGDRGLSCPKAVKVVPISESKLLRVESLYKNGML